MLHTTVLPEQEKGGAGKGLQQLTRHLQLQQHQLLRAQLGRGGGAKKEEEEDMRQVLQQRRQGLREAVGRSLARQVMGRVEGRGRSRRWRTC